MKKCLLYCALISCFAGAASSVADVLEGPNGPVEFLGLENWTAPKLFDAIKDTAQNRGFHACAAVMKSDLDFSDAAVFVFMDNWEDGSWQGYTVVVGVEETPDVQYRTAGNETLELPAAWQKLKDVAEEDFNTLSSVVYMRYSYSEPKDAHEIAEQLGANIEEFDEVWALVDILEEATDLGLALEILKKDESWSSRLVATTVLGLIPDKDASLHGLVDSLIDSSYQVTNMAARVIQGLIRSDKASPIDWSGARDTLLALLAGTNPFVFNDVLKTLIATEINSDFGRELVQAMPDLILAHAGAEHEEFGKPAQDFLAAISGEDFGRDVEAWAKWIEKPDSEL